MNKKLTISATDEKVPFPAAVRGSKTPVLKPSNMSWGGWFQILKSLGIQLKPVTIVTNNLQLCVVKLFTAQCPADNFSIFYCQLFVFSDLHL